MSVKFSLKEIPLFSKLPDETLDEIYPALKERLLDPGEILFNQGDQGSELIIVEEGEIAIFVPVNDESGEGKPIRIFGPGEVLGEMSLIDQKPRSLSARAVTPAKIFTLDLVDFKKLLSENSEMGLSVMVGLNERIRYTTDFLGDVRAWIQQVAAGDYQMRESEIMPDQYQDEEISRLAADFAQMTALVKDREDQLRREVLQLRIEVDEIRKRESVSDIVESDYFKELREKARQLRRHRSSDSSNKS